MPDEIELTTSELYALASTLKAMTETFPEFREALSEPEEPWYTGVDPVALRNKLVKAIVEREPT